MIDKYYLQKTQNTTQIRNIWTVKPLRGLTTDENLVGVIDTKLDIITPLRASQGKLGRIVLWGISLQLTLHISKGRGAPFLDNVQVKINSPKDYSKIPGYCSKFKTNL